MARAFLFHPRVSPSTPLRDKLLALAHQALQGTDVFVLDVQVRGGRGGRLSVDVVADTDRGIGVDELARVSRELGFVFDTHEAIAGAYDLNVLSPGLREPLLPRQYGRHVGRRLEIVLHEGDGGVPHARLEGVLLEATPHGISIELPDGGARSIPFSAIERARVKLPW